MATPNQQSLQHPIVRSPEQFEVPRNPVRVDEALGATEDLDREPDGAPHSVIGLTALFSVMLAILLGFMFLAGGTTLKIAAVVLLLLAVPTLVSSLRSKANRERDKLHPSR